MLKILYIHQYFRLPTESGGTRSFDLALSFKNAGYNIEVITSCNDQIGEGLFKKVVLNDGLIVNYISVRYSSSFGYARRIFSFLKFSLLSSILALRIKADLVLASSTPLSVAFPALLKNRIQRIPFFFEVRDIWPEAVASVGVLRNLFVLKLLERFELYIYNNAECVIALSRDMKVSIESRFGSSLFTPVEVIENIANIDRFETVFSSENIINEICGFKPRFTIVYAGSFGLVNGIDYVIRLAEKLIIIDDSIIFILIGDGPLKDSVLNLASESGVLYRNVFYVPSVSKNELSEFYYFADMGSSFVINVPKLWFNSANKYFNCLAAGRPILINYGGWQFDDINTYNIGYVVPPVLTDEDVRKFARYTLDSELNGIQKANSKYLAISSYSLNVLSNKYINLFRQFTINRKDY